MVDKKSIKNNYLYYLSSQIATISLGVIIIPYLARKLGVKGLGEIAYVNIITQYFILLGNLGMLNYGTRTIGYYNLLEFSEKIVFFSLGFIQIITTAISLILYLVFIHVFFHQNASLFYLSMISVLAGAIDFSWYFIGTGQMKKFAIRNIFVKIITLIFIFTLVKKEKDLSVYILLNSLSFIIVNVFVLYYLPKNFKKIILSLRVVKAHLWPCIRLFLPQLLTLIYLSFDRILLGSLLDKYYLGIYDSALKIIVVMGSITVSLSPIMVSKISGLLRNQNYSLIHEYGKRSLIFTIYISVPLCFGMSAISPTFVPWFFGLNFNAAIQTIIILSPLIILSGTSDVFVNQMILSLKRDKQLYIVLIVLIILNVSFNILLIPKFSNLGAAYANTLSHFLILFLEIYLLKDILNIKPIIKKISGCFISGMIMFLIIKLYKNSFSLTIDLFIEISIGFISYITFSFLIKSKIQAEIFEFLFSKKIFK